MPVDAARAKSLFLAASDLPDPAERAAYLGRECGGDADLRARVEALLRADAADPAADDPGSLATGDYGPDRATVTAGDTPTGRDRSPAAAAGTVIAGRYTLVEVIGEGGMGSVYLAEQSEPVKRQVALKLIKTGMDSRAVLRRFDAERQALAMMDHPNIARIYDGGVTPSGHPFFVMELVRGIAITRYCDEHRLPIPARLELFAAVCQAVQHAHQKGVIHRDLKPGNVLVTEVDGRPTPKVIDFGVAKATEQKLSDQSFADTGAIVGTPAYMSPEQADPSSMDIDTRTDVYALGVILYELLTGAPPFDARHLKRGAILEMLRMVREDDPPRPSTKLSAAGARPNVAANRSIEPAKLAKILRGELDWVVMKAIEKDRTRRYETANGLARDIQRYLADEVVEARPPSTGYRLKKFVRRHKGQVIAATLVLFALLTGMAGTTWGLIEARQQEQIARGETSEKEKARQAEAEQRSVAEVEKEKALQAAAAEKAANAQAQKRLRQVEKANDLLGSIFENLDPKEIARAERPLQAILVEKLGQAAAQLEGESIGDPLVVAAMQNKFGSSLLGLGEPGKAIVLLEKARATRQDQLGPEHPDTLISMNNLAMAYWAARMLDLALPLFKETLKLQKARLGPEHPDTLTSMNNLALAYQVAGMLDLALPLYEETLKLTKARLGPEHPITLGSMNNLAQAYKAAGKRELALPLQEETLQLAKAKLGPEHPNTLTSMSNLATAYLAAGKRDLALPLFEETLKIQKARLGPEHLDTLTSMNNLAMAYQDAGKLDLALPLFEETLKLRKAKLGPEHPETLHSMGNLGKAYCEAIQGEKAVATLKEFVAGMRKRSKPDDPQFAGLLVQVALELLKCRQHAAVEELLRECLAIREKQEPDVWTTFNTMSQLGGALFGQKKYTDAEPLLLKGCEGLKAREKAIPKAGETRIPEALDRLIELYTAMDKPDEAKKWRAERAKYPAPVEKAPPPREVK